MYREYKETLNGRIVYQQMLPEDCNRTPYYVQWVPSATGSFEWVIAQDLNKWQGEIIAKCKHIITGKIKARPLYISTENHRWPSRISGFRWKLHDDNKRGGMVVKAAWEKTEKDIQGKETKTRHGIEIEEINFPEEIDIDIQNDDRWRGTYEKSTELLNGRYFWRSEIGFIQWIIHPVHARQEYVWTISATKNMIGDYVSYDDCWSPIQLSNWRMYKDGDWKTVTVGNRSTVKAVNITKANKVLDH